MKSVKILLSVFISLGLYRYASAANIPTSSTIANVSPIITVTPSDNGSSDATKTNQGSAVTFTVTAKDVNSSQYYLIICKTDAVAAGNDTAPTCPSGQWAVSAATNSNSQATATHIAAGSDATSNDWYAFVCDKTSGALCMPANGMGNRGFAMGTITFSGVPAEGETITVDSVVYEFDTAGNGIIEGNTLVNTSNAETGAEAAALLNTAEAGAISHMQVRSNTVYVYANAYGASGNAITMSTNSSAITISGGNLTGGNEANASPFYVNHTGTFGTVTVTDTNNSASIEPGDILKFKLAQGTITAGSNVNMYICSSSTVTFNYSTNVCTGGSLVCSVTGINPLTTDAICQESLNNLVPIPTSHGSKTFKVFVEDSFDLGAVGNNSQTYSVADIPPTFFSYTTTDSPAPLAGGSDIMIFKALIHDDNGEDDINSAEGSFYDSDVSQTWSAGLCTPDERKCYTASSCTLNTSAGDNTQAEAQCSVAIWFNANAGSGWKTRINFSDDLGKVINNTDSVNPIINPPLSGINVVETGISYGTIKVGDISLLKTSTMENMGNQIIDVMLDGDNMISGSNFIPVSQQKWYHTNTDFNWNAQSSDAGPYSLVDLASADDDETGCLNRDIQVRAVHTDTSTDESIYWKLKIPDTQIGGSYTGLNTFSNTAASTCSAAKPY